MKNIEKNLLFASLLAIASISGAWISELIFGLRPCELCLWQRWPYYIGVPLLLVTLTLHASRAPKHIIFLFQLLSLTTFIISIGLGIFHAGVEWGFWAGLEGCSGKVDTGPASASDFMKNLSKAKVMRCDEAAFRFPNAPWGLSLAGMNAIGSSLISVLIARGCVPFFKSRTCCKKTPAQ